MNVVEAVRRRHGRLKATLAKGADGSRLVRAARRFAYPVGKDRLGYASPGSEMVRADDKKMAATFVVSTVNQDRDGDIVIPAGIRLENYKRNPVWFFGHQLWESPIGTTRNPETGALDVEVKDDRVLATCWFDAEDPDAEYLYGKVKRGILRATSIGFMPLKAERIKPSAKANHDRRPSEEGWPGWRFDEIDLLELSIVGVPSNAEAMRLSLDRDRMSPKLRKALEPFAAPVPVWSPGFRFGHVIRRRAKKRAPAKEVLERGCMTPREARAAEEKAKKDEGRGTDVQAVVVPQGEDFPDEASARAWCEAHNFLCEEAAEGNLNPPGDEGQARPAWRFEQFPDGELAEGSARVEELGDGVLAVVGQRKTEAPMPATRDMMNDDRDKEDMEEGKTDDAPEEDKMEDEPPAEEEPAPEEEAPEEEPEVLPPGAALLRGMSEMLRAAMPMQEQPDVKKLCEKLQGLCAACAAKAYPDLDLGYDAPAAEGEGEGKEEGSDDDEEPGEEEEEEKGRKKSRAPGGVDGVQGDDEDALDAGQILPVLRELAERQERQARRLDQMAGRA